MGQGRRIKTVKLPAQLFKKRFQRYFSVKQYMMNRLHPFDAVQFEPQLVSPWA
jgi:hypothetical protein